MRMAGGCSQLSIRLEQFRVRSGSLAPFRLDADHFRSSPISRQFQSLSALRICANIGSNGVLHKRMSRLGHGCADPGSLPRRLAGLLRWVVSPHFRTIDARNGQPVEIGDQWSLPRFVRLTPSQSAQVGVQFSDDDHGEKRRSCTSREDCREQQSQRVFPACRAAGLAKA